MEDKGGEGARTVAVGRFNLNWAKAGANNVAVTLDKCHCHTMSLSHYMCTTTNLQCI